jgi:hypothetical protein
VSAGSSPPVPPQAHEQAAIAIALPHVHRFRSIVRTAIGESAPNVNSQRERALTVAHDHPALSIHSTRLTTRRANEESATRFSGAERDA